MTHSTEYWDRGLLRSISRDAIPDVARHGAATPVSSLQLECGKNVPEGVACQALSAENAHVGKVILAQPHRVDVLRFGARAVDGAVRRTVRYADLEFQVQPFNLDIWSKLADAVCHTEDPSLRICRRERWTVEAIRPSEAVRVFVLCAYVTSSLVLLRLEGSWLTQFRLRGAFEGAFVPHCARFARILSGQVLISSCRAECAGGILGSRAFHRREPTGRADRAGGARCCIASGEGFCVNACCSYSSDALKAWLTWLFYEAIRAGGRVRPRVVALTDVRRGTRFGLAVQTRASAACGCIALIRVSAWLAIGTCAVLGGSALAENDSSWLARGTEVAGSSAWTQLQLTLWAGRSLSAATEETFLAKRLLGTRVLICRQWGRVEARAHGSWDGRVLSTEQGNAAAFQRSCRRCRAEVSTRTRSTPVAVHSSAESARFTR
eukprot:scaffold599_cov282-Pinguiococcus_pyrenoidosus.AAC.8